MSAVESLTTNLNPSVGAFQTTGDPGRPLVIAQQDTVTFRPTVDTSNSYAARQIEYTVDHDGQTVSGAAFGLRILATVVDGTGLGGNHAPLEVRENGTRIFSVTASNGATPSITAMKRATISDTLTIGVAGATALTFTNPAAVGISAADLTIGSSAAQKVGFHGVAGTTQGAAVADATGAGDVVAQLNALLARIRAKGLIAT